MNCVVSCVSAMPSVSTENSAMQPISVTRRPTRSVSGPTPTAPRPTPTSPRVEAAVSEEAVKPRSPLALRVGMTAPRTTRSKPSSATATQHSQTGQRSRAPLPARVGDGRVPWDGVLMG